jgi:hypothetical protein
MNNSLEVTNYKEIKYKIRSLLFGILYIDERVLLGFHVLVAPTPCQVVPVVMVPVVYNLIKLPGTITRPAHSLHYHLFRHRLELVGPPDSRHKIEESRGGVGAVLSEFAGLVVPGKSMMVVVPSLSSGQKRHD